ncbi:unnamed protein product [Prunus armeniaca]
MHVRPMEGIIPVGIPLSWISFQGWWSLLPGFIFHLGQDLMYWDGELKVVGRLAWHTLFGYDPIVIPKRIAFYNNEDFARGWLEAMVSSQYRSCSVSKSFLKAEDAIQSSHPTMLAFFHLESLYIVSKRLIMLLA